MTDNNLFPEDLDKILQKLQDQLDDLDSDYIDEIEGIQISDLESAYNQIQPQIELKYKKDHTKSVDPSYHYESDSGFDLFSVEKVYFQPFERKLVPTGLFFNIPENYEIQVRSKSGLALNQGLVVLNSPGTVDQGYTGEIKVVLMNINNSDIVVEVGQKIAQGVLCPVVSGKWVKLVEQNTIKQNERGSNGFGSTGL
jgi:dUTP pyrophosphatase